VKNSKPFPLVELAILAFCAWLSRDLLNAWQHSPHDKFGWLALLIWLLPLGWRLWRKENLAASVWFLGAAIITGAVGELSEFHFLGHAALAFSLAAWLPLSPWLAVWLATALSWMPVLGWELGGFSGGAVLFSRLVLALAGVVCLWPFRKDAAKT
jgi:hypothetical protein